MYKRHKNNFIVIASISTVIMIVTFTYIYISSVFSLLFRGIFVANLHRSAVNSLAGTLTIVFHLVLCGIKITTECCNPIESHLLFSVHYTNFVSNFIVLGSHFN